MSMMASESSTSVEAIASRRVRNARRFNKPTGVEVVEEAVGHSARRHKPRAPRNRTLAFVGSDLGPPRSDFRSLVRLDLGPVNEKGLRATTRNPSRKSSGGKI